MEGCPLFWGLAVGYGTSANIPVANLYTITGMDVAADLVTGIWVEVVATVRVGAVGVMLEGIGWASTLTVYLLLASTVPLLFSLVLSPRAFLVMGLLFWGQVLVLGCGWVGHGCVCCSWVWGWGLVWDQAFPLIPNMFSSFR